MEIQIIFTPKIDRMFTGEEKIVLVHSNFFLIDFIKQ
jgi:hypothetical protein